MQRDVRWRRNSTACSSALRRPSDTTWILCFWRCWNSCESVSTNSWRCADSDCRTVHFIAYSGIISCLSLLPLTSSNWAVSKSHAFALRRRRSAARSRTKRAAATRRVPLRASLECSRSSECACASEKLAEVGAECDATRRDGLTNDLTSTSFSLARQTGTVIVERRSANADADGCQRDVKCLAFPSLLSLFLSFSHALSLSARRRRTLQIAIHKLFVPMHIYIILYCTFIVSIYRTQISIYNHLGAKFMSHYILLLEDIWYLGLLSIHFHRGGPIWIKGTLATQIKEAMLRTAQILWIEIWFFNPSEFNFYETHLISFQTKMFSWALYLVSRIT